MSDEDHAIKGKRRRGRVHTIICTYGLEFQSINSEGWARMYHTTHVKQQREAVQK